MLALSIGLWAATLGLGRAHGPLPGVPVFDAVDVVTYSAFLAWTVVGSVIISRRPSNRIGWLLSAAGLLVLLGSCATHYALVALLGIGGLALLPGAAPGGFVVDTAVSGLSLVVVPAAIGVAIRALRCRPADGGGRRPAG